VEYENAREVNKYIGELEKRLDAALLQRDERQKTLLTILARSKDLEVERDDLKLQISEATIKERDRILEILEGCHENCTGACGACLAEQRIRVPLKPK
jgi:hypothetical protein